MLSFSLTVYNVLLMCMGNESSLDAFAWVSKRALGYVCEYISPIGRVKSDDMFKFDVKPKDFRSIGYARALRSVGLLLQMRNLQTFDLRCETCEFRLECGYQSPPCSTPVEMRYSLDDIESLEAENQPESKGLYETVDFLSLGEVLRGMGAYVDKQGGRLVRISNNESSMAPGSVKLQYETSDGNLKEEVFSLPSIYELCVHLHKERSKPSRSKNIFVGSR